MPRPAPAKPASDATAATLDEMTASLEAEAGYSDFPLAQAKSLVIFGSHTLFELVLAAFVDVGLLPEMLYTSDLLRFAYITDKVRLSCS